jgi:hypothetical protein
MTNRNVFVLVSGELGNLHCNAFFPVEKLHVLGIFYEVLHFVSKLAKIFLQIGAA